MAKRLRPTHPEVKFSRPEIRTLLRMVGENIEAEEANPFPLTGPDMDHLRRLHAKLNALLHKPR